MYSAVTFLPKTPLLFNPGDDYRDTITDGFNIYRTRTVMPGSGRPSVCQVFSLPHSTQFANAVVLLLLISLLVTITAHTPQRGILLVVSS